MRQLEKHRHQLKQLSQRDPKMHRSKKVNQWHFGRATHIGVDVTSGLTHIYTDCEDKHDLNQAHYLAYGEEVYVCAYFGYRRA